MSFSPDDISWPLLPVHREVMFELILVWGRIDGALGMVVGRALEMPMTTAADYLAGMKASHRFDAVFRALKSQPDGPSAARKWRKHKRSYEKFSKVRNRIAHTNCRGYLSTDPNYVVFLIFEREGEQDLAAEAIPLGEMRRATAWGSAFLNLLFLLVPPDYGPAAASGSADHTRP